MIFEKIANAVVRHHLKILAIWAIILFYAVPAVLKVNDVLVYQEAEMVAGDIESLTAQEIIDEQFPTSLANSTLMVVAIGPDMTSEEARDFCFDVESRVGGPDGMAYLTDFASVYSVYRDVTTGAILEIGPMIHETEALVNSTAFLLYGIPSVHLNNWVYMTDPGASVAERDAVAYALTIGTLEVLLAEEDPSMAQAAYQYYSLFAGMWNSTSSNTTLVPDPEARAEYSIGSAAPQFVVALPYPDDQKAMMLAVVDAFDLGTFSNASLIHSFTIGTVAFYAGIEDMAFMEGVYALGPDYTLAESAAMADEIVRTRTASEYPVAMPSEYLSSFISSDNTTTLVVLSFSKSSNYMVGDTKPIVDNVELLRSIVADAKAAHLSDSYNLYVTGDAALTADMESSMLDDLMLIEPITIALIIVLMGFFFRSVVAQFLPLGSVMVALGVSQAVVFMVGSLVADIHYTVVTMLFSILMGVGTDYAIFIVARYREERIKGRNKVEAVRTSVTWAGESITTSGATVMISFFALGIADFSMIRTMGLVLGMAVGISILVALTLVPSLLLIFGNRIFWPTTKNRWKEYASKVMEKRMRGDHGYFYKAADYSIRHAKAVIAVALLISIPTTYVFVTAETSFDFIEGMGSGSESSKGIVEMTDAFGAGRIMPTQIVAVMQDPVYLNGSFDVDALDSIHDFTLEIAAVGNVKQVNGPTNPNGAPIDYRNLSSLPAEARASVEMSMLQSVGLDGRTVLITVVLVEGPMAPDSLDTVSELRALVAEFKAGDPLMAESEVLVGGATAVIYDLKLDLDEQFRTMEILVVIGIFIVLLVVLGAVLISLFAILSIMLSISWAFAATVALFGYGLGAPILWIIPLILFIMLMGIGMDYNVFILTRIREEIHKGRSDKEAILESLDWTGGIITALAIIMGSAFSAMMISSTMMLKEIGFALAFAIMLDAMIVRTYFVPAMMTLLGRRAWWAPGRLQRERRERRLRSVREARATCTDPVISCQGIYSTTGLGFMYARVNLARVCVRTPRNHFGRVYRQGG
ncbi:TPA: MMPL family transporter, partial [Thermoplasmata archaeon]|nr:MMPL family transporter [Thermoplasmata archaeon]